MNDTNNQDQPRIYWRLFIAKVLIAICFYVFVIEPILFENITKKGNFAFLDRHEELYFALIFFMSAFVGYIHGKIRNSFFSVSEWILIGIAIYTIILGFSRYDLYPLDFHLKYVYILLLVPVISLLTYGYLKISAFLKKSDKGTRGNIGNEVKIELDLTLTELAKFSNGKINDHDTLGYYDLARPIFNTIKSLKPSKAFSIGLNGIWGSGKSSLIDIIRDDLISNYNKTSADKINVISFSPWLYPGQGSLVANFFLKWKAQINDLRIDMAFDDYSAILNDISVAGVSVKLQHFLFEQKGLEQIKKDIATYLGNQTDIFVVVIDDLDRLEKPEILEVAKLSRILADFPNTFYILAYDRQYIDSVLKEESLDEDGKIHTYFDKIIQLEFKIPQTSESSLAAYISSIINKNKMFITTANGNLNDTIIEEALSTINSLGLYQHFLPTIRDVKRFLNGFLLKYNSLSRNKGNIDFKKIFLLEMIFYKYKDEYQKFYLNRENVVKDQSHVISLFANGQDNRNLKDAFAIILGDKETPLQKSKLIYQYYSYFNFNQITDADIDNFSFGTSQTFNYYNDLGLGGDFIVKYVRQLSSYAIEGSRNFTFKILADKWENNFVAFRNHINRATEKLSQVDKENISNCFAELWNQLKEPLKGSAIEGEGISKNRCRALLENFTLYYDIFDPQSDESNFTLNSLSSPDIDEQMDDCYYDKVFDLRYSYEITLTGIDIEYWRIGFKFSPDNKFPISRRFRLNFNFPLFHLNQENGRIGATFYPLEHNTDREKSNKQINDFTLNSVKELKIKLYKNEQTCVIEIIENNETHAVFTSLPLAAFNSFKIFAWCDNNNDYEIKVNVNSYSMDTWG